MSKENNIVETAESFSVGIEKAAVYLKDALVDVSPQVFEMTVKAVQMHGIIGLSTCIPGVVATALLVKSASYNEEGVYSVGGGISAIAALLIGLVTFFSIASTSLWMKIATPELFLTLKAYEAVGITF